MTARMPRGATIDYRARARRATEQASNALRAFALCQLSGRHDEASQAFQRVADRLAELETEIIPNL